MSSDSASTSILTGSKQADTTAATSGLANKSALSVWFQFASKIASTGLPLARAASRAAGRSGCQETPADATWAVTASPRMRAVGNGQCNRRPVDVRVEIDRDMMGASLLQGSGPAFCRRGVQTLCLVSVEWVAEIPTNPPPEPRKCCSCQGDRVICGNWGKDCLPPERRMPPCLTIRPPLWILSLYRFGYARCLSLFPGSNGLTPNARLLGFLSRFSVSDGVWGGFRLES